jgi:hypothetical protein
LTWETVEHVSSDQSEGIPADGEIGRDGGFGGKGEGVVEIARSSRFAEEPQDMPTGRKVLDDGKSTGIAGCGDEGSIGAVEFGAQAIPAGSGKIEETRTGEFEEVGMHGTYVSEPERQSKRRNPTAGEMVSLASSAGDVAERVTASPTDAEWLNKR